MILVEWGPISEIESIPPFGSELEKHLNTRRCTVRHASCSAWWLLFKVLTEKKIPYGTLVFDKNGKPGFAGQSVFISLTHSKGVCAVAVSDRPVGVDVEVCRDNYLPRLIDRSLTNAEKATFDGDFTRMWCRKEAAAKLTGEGLSGYPNHIDTTELDTRFYEYRIQWDSCNYWLVAIE